MYEITFSKLESNSAQHNINAYQQDHLWVTIDSRKRNSSVDNISPGPTLAYAKEAKYALSSKTTKNMGVSVSIPVAPQPGAVLGASWSRANEEGHNMERQKYTSRIIQNEFRGLVWWVFQIEDDHERENGARITADRLPTAKFVYRRPENDSKTLAEEHIDAEVTSSWTCIPSRSVRNGWRTGEWSEWLKQIVSRAKSAEGVPYSNFSQIVALKIPAILAESSDYVAILTVDTVSGKVKDKEVDEEYGPVKVGPDIRISNISNIISECSFYFCRSYILTLESYSKWTRWTQHTGASELPQSCN